MNRTKQIGLFRKPTTILGKTEKRFKGAREIVEAASC